MALRDLFNITTAGLLGGSGGQFISTALAKAGLRGLGINLDHRLMYSGEQYLIDAVAPILRDGLAIDVGANVGDYSELLLSRGVRNIIAFEPIQTTFDQLKRTLGHVGTVQLVKAAVGERDGEISLFVPDLSADSTLVSRDRNVAGLPEPTSSAQTVEIVSLDSFLPLDCPSPALLKIDVEGFELEVLTGASGLLRRAPPQLIQFEFNIHHARRHQTLEDFRQALPGYALYRLAARSLRPIDTGHYLGTIYAFQNVIAIHEGAQRIRSRLGVS